MSSRSLKLVLWFHTVVVFLMVNHFLLFWFFDIIFSFLSIQLSDDKHFLGLITELSLCYLSDPVSPTALLIFGKLSFKLL